VKKILIDFVKNVFQRVLVCNLLSDRIIVAKKRIHVVEVEVRNWLLFPILTRWTSLMKTHVVSCRVTRECLRWMWSEAP